MSNKIRVAVLDDHQISLDGYQLRLGDKQDIEVVATALNWNELEPLLDKVDVLLLDVEAPVSPDNPNPYPILHELPRLLQKHPDLSALIISMHSPRTLIQALMDAGASGYVLKNDADAMRELDSIIRTVANGGIYLSKLAYQLFANTKGGINQPLSARQLEALSLAASYPNESTGQIAARLNIANSSLRNLLSGAYLKLGVRTRAAAVAKARQSGLISPEARPPGFGN